MSLRTGATGPCCCCASSAGGSWGEDQYSSRSFIRGLASCQLVVYSSTEAHTYLVSSMSSPASASAANTRHVRFALSLCSGSSAGKVTAMDGRKRNKLFAHVGVLSVLDQDPRRKRKDLRSSSAMSTDPIELRKLVKQLQSASTPAVSIFNVFPCRTCQV